ncbi:MAG: hypothetical protein SZ59_C0003G0083 [candidate division TM6 bacterium GW2011_GWF2_28_16]|nr:MAG: hypothetical protein SZ59_C0003G0083 [candidate division TM6 bacterium GW2011_GWF2_28_16]
MNKRLSMILNIAWAITLLLVCANFTDGAKKDSAAQNPEFVKVLDGESLVNGTIYDDQNVIPAKQISFSGHSKIGGVRRESDDSINVLDLTKIKEIKILNENYMSPRYQDKEYILVEVTAINGAITKDLLVPRDVVICAISKETEMEKAWYLKKLSKIDIDLNGKPQVVEAPKGVVKQTN